MHAWESGTSMRNRYRSQCQRGPLNLSPLRPRSSVFPLLDSKSLAHDVHLSVETVDAPAAAIAAAVAKVADEVEAALVVLGTNNALVRPWGVTWQWEMTYCCWFARDVGGAVHATRLPQP
jgi:hypothetical protein